MKVLNDHVIVLEDGREERSEGGLYISDSVANANPIRQGTVFAVDEENEDIKVGDRFLFNITNNAYVGETVYEDKNLRVLLKRNIIAVI